MYLIDSFAVRFKQLRKESGMTQEKLAEALDVSIETLKKWEKGGNIKIRNLILVSIYFNVSLDYLIGRDDDRTIY